MNSKRRSLVFHKMHSLGNDFMVIEAVTQSVTLEPEQIARWGDRNTGIGFDQLLVIEAPTSAEADFWYRVYNCDGSSAEQCGNGTRAVALLARTLDLSKKSELIWQSAAGMICTQFESEQRIVSNMTVPVLTLPDIPFDPAHAQDVAQGNVAQFQLAADDQLFTVTPISMGNPHAVLFVDDLFDIDVATVGAKLTSHPAYPDGANIGFCQVVDRHFLRLRVYERGTGETRACGSGACAAMVAARLHDKVDQRVKVSLPGGKLRISWLDPQSPVTMSGAATLVFRGELQT
jgi:diaminopimelate epimerase